MPFKYWVEIIAIATLPVAIIAVIVNRTMVDRGLGARAIQFLAISLFVPIIVLLALEGVLERSAVGALVGALVGYLFATTGEFDKKRNQTDAQARFDESKDG